MSTTHAVHPLHEITSLLAAEVRCYGQDAGGFNGTAVISCFQNVVRVDLGMQLAELPEVLSDLYRDADLHKLNVYDAEVLARKIDAIGAGVPT